jgi:hypothetical protein
MRSGAVNIIHTISDFAVQVCYEWLLHKNLKGPMEHVSLFEIRKLNHLQMWSIETLLDTIKEAGTEIDTVQTKYPLMPP